MEHIAYVRSYFLESFPHIPIDIRERLINAIYEINIRFGGLPEEDPRREEIIREVFRQNRFGA